MYNWRIGKDAEMKYSDYCSKFYIGRNSSGILRHNSKEKIPRYFFSIALSEEHDAAVLFQGCTYGKWFTGERKPGDDIWDEVISDSKKTDFISEITKDLNDSVLRDVMHNFGLEVQPGETPDKRLFASTIADLFYAIAKGNGETASEANNFYNPEAHIISFPEYITRTIAKYEKIKMPFSEGEERLIDDIYVCNKLSSRSSTTKNWTSRTQEKIILDATLDSLKAYSRKVILVANGGMGKTMLVQHLFLESARKHAQTGRLPIIIELRNFSSSNDLLDDYIIKTANTYDENLTSQKVEELMISGKCEILMDGADEIDPSDEKTFQRKIGNLINKYPNNQYVLASRECGLLKGITGFSWMYLHPFSGEQSTTLIDNLLKNRDDEAIIESIKKYMEGDFLQRHKVFASNPMLLTLVIMKYPIVESFDGKKRLFYREVYATIVHKHDEEKEGYSRVFRSAQDAAEFTKVFAELCATTYMKHETEFDFDAFEGYFDNLVTKKSIETPKAMTIESFTHDACATACMMYEQETKLLYIDPGFQEYLFAKYYFSVAPEELIALGQSLWDIAETEFDRLDAFEMLNEFSPKKYEQYFLKPFLKNVFQGKDEAKHFIKFLRYGYRDLEYQMIDHDCVTMYETKEKSEWVSPKPAVTEPSSIVFSMLLRKLNISCLLVLAIFEETLDYHEFMTAGIYGELYSDPADNKNKIIPRRLLLQDPQAYKRTSAVEKYVCDDKGQLVCFGHEYKVDFNKVLETPENYTDLIKVLKTPKEDVWKVFCKVKDYYEDLVKKYDT
jgi:hypothetical protein